MAYSLSDHDKLLALVKQAGFNRAQLARLIEVSYQSIYRWLDHGTKPHPSASHRIDELFKEHVDLVPVVEKLKKDLRNPIRILKENDAARRTFFLEMTYHSNAIEGS